MKNKRKEQERFYSKELCRGEILDFEKMIKRLKNDRKTTEKRKREIILQYCPVHWDYNMAGWLLREVE
jgi:hypothetical protein